jgi:hypothetical protein
MAWVWDHGPDRQSERFVLLALANFSNDEGECWPSMAGIARKVCMTERGVQKVIRSLEAEGWISTLIGRGRKGCNQYLINRRNPEPRLPFDEPKTPNNVHPEQRSPRTRVQKTPNVVHHPPEPRSPEPSKIHQEPLVREESAREALASVIGGELADAFVAHRKALRSPMTPHAGKLMAKKLAAMADPGASVERSITSGWKDVFPPKAEVTQFPSKRPSNGRGLDDHLDALKARLAVQRLE